jgi:salicylate synthetase
VRSLLVAARAAATGAEVGVTRIEIAGAFGPTSVARRLGASRSFRDWIVWADERSTVVVAGARASVTLEGTELAVRDADGRVGESIATTDPFTDLAALVARVANGRAMYGYLGFELAGFRYPYAKRTGRALHLVAPRVTCVVEDGRVVVEADDDIAEEARVALSAEEPRPATRVAALDDATVQRGREAYVKAIETARERVRAGDLDKVIVSRQVVIDGKLDPLASYDAAAATAGARRFAFALGTVTGVGVCPAIMMTADASGEIRTNPLAGTMPRGKTPEEDVALARELLRNTKETSEHAASILLAYEELRRVVTPESLRVIDFMQLKRYPFTQHLSSIAVGSLKANESAWSALRELFPGVTASGIPKREALGVIDRLESQLRGVYAGCMGRASPDGSMDWGITLRSAFDYGAGVSLDAGAGVVADSDPEFEFMESVNKMRTMASRLVLVDERTPRA